MNAPGKKRGERQRGNKANAQTSRGEGTPNRKKGGNPFKEKRPAALPPLQAAKSGSAEAPQLKV